MKTKRLLSGVMSIVMIFTMFFAMTLVVNTTAPLTASAATTTEKAIFIGSTTKTVACAFIPLDITVDSDTWYELSFKCKTLKNGNSNTQADKPSIGILGQHDSSNYYVETCPSWAGNYGSGGSTNDYNFHTSYSSGVYTMRFKLRSGSCNQSVSKYSDWGNRTFYLTIGNAAFRNPTGNTIAFQNLGASFIFSDISLYLCESESGSTSGDSLIPQINDSNVDFGGTYFFRKDNSADVDGPISATANKWHVMAMPDHVKYVTVPSDYNTSSNYDAANFSQTAETDYTREYYTNTNYTDLTFAKLANSDDAGYQVISDINKKMIVIDANHEGEADDRTTDGYKPVYNRPANIFIPLSLGQYNINTYGVTTDTSYLARISMKAVRLEGDGYPVLGRITPRDTDHSQALGKMAKNLHLSGYYGAGSHEQYTGGDYSYNESTGEFVGWVRVKGGDSTYKTKYGTSEIITIGNAEHVWAEGTFDTTEFNSSFAISDIKVDLYSYTGSYTVDSLLYEDVALPLYAETIDTSTPWAYQCNGQSYSAHSRDVARASQTTWNAEGCVGMVHTMDLTACMDGNHTLAKTAATDTTREYYTCAACSKTFADPWGVEEITDLTAKKQMVVMAAANGTESIFHTVKLNGFENNQWFKFTCKVERSGEGVPVVSSLYAKYDGTNVCETTASNSNDGDFAFFESSYDPSTGILTGYMKAWIKNTINQSNRYPFERMNPVSGANCAIVIGNGRYIGDGYTEQTSDTSFTITEPELYKVDGATTGGTSGLEDAKTKSVTGDNLLAPITDKTVDFDSDYVATWTNANNPLAAPIGKWYKTGNKKSEITAQNIPEPPTQTEPKMLKIAGFNSSSSAQAIINDTVLESSTTYQFDMDCRAFGGTYIPRIIVQDKIEGGSYTTVSGGDLDEAFNGYHYTLQFTTRANLASGNNFRLQIGLAWNARNMSSMYIANVQVRKVIDSTTFGENILKNGDFSYSSVGAVTADNVASQMLYWNGLSNLTKHYDVRIMAIPTGFFDSADTAITGRDDIAIRIDNTDWTELQFKTELEADTYYRLSFNYREMHSMPDLELSNSNVTATKISNNENGEYKMTYEIYANSSVTRNSDKDPNTRFRFRFKEKANTRTLYINNVELYKLDGTGGNIVGVNLMGNLNAIYDDSVYSELVNDRDEIDVTINQDGEDAISRDLLNGWFGSKYTKAGDPVFENVKLVKVPAGFFNYMSRSQRIDLMQKVILGTEATDDFDPHYNPNGDDVWGDVKDYVHAKQAWVAEAAE